MRIVIHDDPVKKMRYLPVIRKHRLVIICVKYSNRQKHQTPTDCVENKYTSCELNIIDVSKNDVRAVLKDTK
jgi:ABC-type metal ion transport system substrate-binding protein